MPTPGQSFLSTINDKETVGVAILAAFKDVRDRKDFNLGLKEDIKKMSNVFKELKFAVYDTQFKLKEGVKAIISEASKYKYPDSIKYICFYYSGHGRSSDGRPFIFDKNNDQLDVIKDIVSPFYPENAPQLGHCIRLFFFDCCLTQPLDKCYNTKEKPYLLLPARGNCLIAFSTAMNSVSKLDSNGSYWTDILSKQLLLNERLSTILDVTHEETVSVCRKWSNKQEDIQGPHYISCVGQVCLKG